MAGLLQRGRAGFAAMLVMLVLALPGFFTLPPVDRDEARFAQSSAQMLASGDVIDIRLGDDPRWKKPAGIYWLQAASAGLTGAPGEIWSYRLISLLAAMASVGLTVAIARRVMGEVAALLAGVMLAASFLMGGEARLAKTDAAQLAAILASVLVLARLFLPAGRGQTPTASLPLAMGFWATLAVGILIKGPIPVLVALGTLSLLCLYRRDLALLRALRPLPGIALLLALVLPWLIAITIRSDGAFWAASVGEDLLAKVGAGQENHGAPPGSYLAALWLTFWPGAALFAAALPALWRGRREAVVIFCLAWAVPVWLVFELTATKLIHYVLPAYPALAILTAWGLQQAVPGRWAKSVASLLAVAVAALLPVALWVGAGQVGGALGWPFWLGAVALLPGLALLLTGLWCNRRPAMTAGLAGLGMALAVMLYPTLARMPPIWPSVALAEAGRAHPGCRLITLGFGEPSLLFLTRAEARFATEESLPGLLAEPGCVLLAVADGTAPEGMQPEGRLEGFTNLGSGKRLDFALYLRP
ncbi:glycosyltransferase family 39 protein [Paracoccaceae bacterium]